MPVQAGAALSLTRRGFTIRLASLIAAGVAHPALGQDELQSFRALSARLTGFSEAGIDPELALHMMDGLRAAGLGDALDGLLENGAGDGGRARRASPLQEPLQGNPASELARQIAVAWYSGMHPGARGTSLRAYYDALVWRALDYTRPPGQFSAAPEDWSEPPAGAAQ